MFPVHWAREPNMGVGVGHGKMVASSTPFFDIYFLLGVPCLLADKRQGRDCSYCKLDRF